MQIIKSFGSESAAVMYARTHGLIVVLVNGIKPYACVALGTDTGTCRVIYT